MKYIALLRGINVGKERRVDMKKLKLIFERLGFTEVSTYINSGNVIFKSGKTKNVILCEIKQILKKEFDFEIPVLVKTEKEIKKIADAIPKNWQNDKQQRTDIAYLFKEIDSEKIVRELPFNTEFVDLRYIKGAVFWNIVRKDYGKSRLNKLIGSKFYKYMTLRNVNTARFLAS
ncbi:MAG: DUF1697 domain-containing protein [Endomicrobiaceae bacterium]|nr:DUF1697 domain-containing protein [Endomicrobiaceae bacterium]